MVLYDNVARNIFVDISNMVCFWVMRKGRREDLNLLSAFLEGGRYLYTQPSLAVGPTFICHSSVPSVVSPCLMLQYDYYLSRR